MGSTPGVAGHGGRKLESSAEEALVSKSSAISKIKSVADILPKVSEDEGCNHIDTDSQNGDPSRLSAECIPSEIVTAKSGEESDAKLPEIMDPELEEANHAVKAAKKRQMKRDDAFLCTAIKAQIKTTYIKSYKHLMVLMRF